MAFIKDVSAEQDKGKWFRIGEDPDSGDIVELRVRRVPEPLVRKYEAQHGIEKDVDVPYDDGTRKGTARLRTRVHSLDELRAIRVQVAEFGWLDTRNFKVKAEDDEKAARYAKLVGDPSITAGTEFSLDGRLTDGVKHYLLDNWSELLDIVSQKVGDLAKERLTKEGDARKN